MMWHTLSIRTCVIAAGLAAISAAQAQEAVPCELPLCETAEGKIPLMTALTRNGGFECLTRTFPGEDRVAEMPGTSVNFQQGGSSAQSVLVTFVANWLQPGLGIVDLPPGSQPAGAVVFLEIDGDRTDVVSRQGGVLVHEGTATSVSNGTHGFTFVTEPIPPGKHTATMLWANNLLNGTGTICVAKRSLVVQHR